MAREDGNSKATSATGGELGHPEELVTFALPAPGKASVELIGDFNDWQRGVDPLHEVEAGLWVIEKELPRGAFAYRYVIDGQLEIADPHAHHVRQPPGDAPHESIVKPGQPPYPWQHDNWVRPAFSDLHIYEMHIADFTPQRSFREAIDRLDHVRDLGMNAIELMPVFGVHETKGWGYTPSYLMAVNEDYGDPDDFKWLVDEAHGKGLAVILDIVLAHTGHEHPFNQMYPYEQSPWYGEGPAGGNMYGLPQFDYAKPATRAFVERVLRHWLEDFHVDGFRFDYTSSIGVTEEGYGVPTLAWAGRQVRSDTYLIAEHLPEDPGLILHADMDGAWHARFSHAIKALMCEREVHGYRFDEFEKAMGALLDPAHEGYGDRPSAMVNYAESHDEQRLMHDLFDAGFDEHIARRKSALAATLLFTAAGVPMLYHGQVWGQDTPKNMDHNYLNWEALATPGGKGLRDHYARMVRLRREHAALRSEHIKIEHIDADHKCVVYRRWADDGKEALIAVNCSPSEQRIPMELGGGEPWHEVFSDEQVNAAGRREITADRYAAVVLIRS